MIDKHAKINTSFAKTMVLIVVLLLLLPVCVYSQDFKVSPMIEIPGDNIDLDILSSMSWDASYMCWINKHDSIYTVYLKQLSPIPGDNLSVSTDSSIKINPVIAQCSNGIRIAWQSKKEDHWQVYTRNYLSDQFGDPELILDSLENDPQIALSNTRIAWINEGNLHLRTFGSDSSGDMLLDSGNCSSPKLLKYDTDLYLEMLYVKNITDSLKVYHVMYNEYRDPKYTYSCLSNGPLSDHPRFGAETGDGGGFGVSFQTKVNDIWKCVYGVFEMDDLVITGNRECNFQHPVFFNYPMPTSSGTTTPYFLAFDTDSLADNREIFIQSVECWDQEPLLNISQSTGDDRKPAIAWLRTNDSMFVSIFWEHEENNKTDIWYAKSPFSDGSAIWDEEGNPITFYLLHNYPNPFNPTTTLQYGLPEACDVDLVIFDITGRKIKEWSIGNQQAGWHKLIWDGTNQSGQQVSTGVYIYSLRAGDPSASSGQVFVDTKKMVLMK
jgi:hypothetical protein